MPRSAFLLTVSHKKESNCEPPDSPSALLTLTVHACVPAGNGIKLGKRQLRRGDILVARENKIRVVSLIEAAL